MVEQVADTYSKGGKYAFLNYTVYDGIDVLGNAIDVLYDKIDGFLSSKALKVFKFYDKPITFVSKELNKLLYQENEELNVVVEPKSKTVTLLKGKLKEIGAKAGKVIIRKPLNNLAGGITEFVASESVRVFSKNSSSNKIKAVKKDA